VAHAPGDRQSGHTAVHRVGSGAGRVGRAWRSLPGERRLAAGAAIGLFVTLFLPWYSVTGVTGGHPASATVSGWHAFSFVEAAVLLVAGGVLTLLFRRAEGRAFHIPGGDGWTITAAGVWAAVLVVWRIFDKQSVRVTSGTAISGVEWGIFLALAIAILLAYAGSRVRAAHAAEPPLPGERPPGPADVAPGEAALPAPARQSESRFPARQAEPPAPQRPAEPPAAQRPAEPPAERPPGWLSAKPKQRQSDEQLTIPLDEQDA
jgi:hypothetical protein